ncbi:hypothetical protein [Corynebacterium crudilactis]|uniref:Transposase n=1 Tax=Corynebacterium crudilactis TaxID=1652495 RepID=A0A172QTU3_9CORY|nr:hypothetical protein [Corynebacterium crudilactis]ANE02926.1 hypothetical protein ccrud_00935 [Corynebacterium crudilactis]ANE04127.1 hypothetical protein ccrud_07835 [Corynebacterium crudilactis]
MTVNIPTNYTDELTPEQKRAHVIAYLSRKHGTKAAYLTEHNLSASAVMNWRNTLADGDLEQGIIPRKTGRMTFKEVRENTALRTEIDDLKAQLAAANAHIDSSNTTVEKQQKNIEELHNAIDALGKAIAIMHKDGVA